MPDVFNVHVDAVLSNFANVHQNGRLVGDLVAPPVKVMKESDYYLELRREETKIQEFIIGEDSEADEFEWDGDWRTYATQPRAVRMFLSQRKLNNADSPFKIQIRTTEKLTNALKISREYRIWQAAVARAAASSQTTTPSNNWNVAAGVPILDLVGAKESFRDATGGAEATHIVMGASVADALASNDDIIGKRAYTDPNTLKYGLQLPSPFLGLIPIVPTGHYNTADEGATASYSPIWGDDAYLITVDRPSIDYDGWMCQFHVDNMFRVRKWRDDKRGYGGGLYIQVELNSTEKEINTACLWELKDLI